MSEIDWDAYATICEDLSSVPGVVTGKMFGMPTLKVNGKAFAGMHGEAMVFKLGPTDIQSALSIPGAAHFDPMGGRPMREWVTVPSEQSSRWSDLAASALKYVGGIAAS